MSQPHTTRTTKRRTRKSSSTSSVHATRSSLVIRRPRASRLPVSLQSRARLRRTHKSVTVPLHFTQVFHSLPVAKPKKHTPIIHRGREACQYSPQRKPKVLMFGWEFPPQSSGGLGTACEGLTKAMVEQGTQLTFVVPHSHAGHPQVRIRSASGAPLRFRGVHSLLAPYLSEDEYERRVRKQVGKSSSMYGSTLFLEVHRYARQAQHIAREEDFDIIHAHDWMTYPAAVAAKHVSGKPFIAHVHATEFDRSGGNPYPAVYHLEREGLHAADHIVAVSNYTKQKIVEHYGISPEKVTVVHNAVEQHTTPPSVMHTLPRKTVLFLGRITLQKGPDYFLAAAKKVLAHEPDTLFIMAGKGDMEQRMIEQAAAMGIGRNVLFAGFAQGPEVDQLYRMADLYVMPSVSEPFGITPLEALRNDTPVLISKQSGVSEVLKNAMRVDFWDIDEMANKIVSALRYPALRDELRTQGKAEIQAMRWDRPAAECLNAYRKVLGW